MPAVRTDQKVLGYLGRALSLELSAVQLYSTQASLARAWGLSKVAAKLQEEVGAELAHAESIIARMLAVGAAPAASQLRSPKLGGSVAELIAIDLAFEKELIELYRTAVSYSTGIGDHDSQVFFNGLLDDELGHYDALLQWQSELQAGTGSAAPASRQG